MGFIYAIYCNLLDIGRVISEQFHSYSCMPRHEKGISYITWIDHAELLALATTSNILGPKFV